MEALLELDDDDAGPFVPVSPLRPLSNEPKALSRFNPPDVPEHPQPPLLSDEEDAVKGLPSSVFLQDSESVDVGVTVSAFPKPR